MTFLEYLKEWDEELNEANSKIFGKKPKTMYIGFNNKNEAIAFTLKHPTYFTYVKPDKFRDGGWVDDSGAYLWGDMDNVGWEDWTNSPIKFTFRNKNYEAYPRIEWVHGKFIVKIEASMRQFTKQLKNLKKEKEDAAVFDWDYAPSRYHPRYNPLPINHPETVKISGISFDRGKTWKTKEQIQKIFNAGEVRKNKYIATDVKRKNINDYNKEFLGGDKGEDEDYEIRHSFKTYHQHDEMERQREERIRAERERQRIENENNPDYIREKIKELDQDIKEYKNKDEIRYSSLINAFKEQKKEWKAKLRSLSKSK